MQKLFLIAKNAQVKEEVILELDPERYVEELLPEIVSLMGLPGGDTSAEPPYQLRNEDQRVLETHKRIGELGLENFSDVFLVPYAGTEVGTEKTEDEDGLPDLRLNTPALISDTGIVFMLDHFPLTIGRKSRGWDPDIDLSELDTSFICSRKHAEITSDRGGGCLLHCFAPRNGMFLNGQILSPETVTRLEDGDRLQFGFGGITLLWKDKRA